MQTFSKAADDSLENTIAQQNAQLNELQQQIAQCVLKCERIRIEILQ